MATNTYDAEGIVPVAYALFVLGLAVALGALWRRTVPALLSAFVALRRRACAHGQLAASSAWSARLTTTWPLRGRRRPEALNRGLVVDQFLSDKSGQAHSGRDTSSASERRRRIVHTRIVGLCSPARPHGYMTAIYIPPSRFWDLQAVEFGLVAGIGAILILAAGWWTHRRFS